MIKEEALLLRDQPVFPAVTELAKRGLLSPETWHCNRPRVSLKTSIDVPMLGTVIEQNGDGLLEESHMPIGWPLHIEGAVRQQCGHRDTTLLLSEYDMKRDLVEINRKAPQWAHNAVWNKWYMEPKSGFTLSQLCFFSVQRQMALARSFIKPERQLHFANSTN
jgi:hypothetical protein